MRSDVLVLGATGFVGTHLCEALAAAGHGVRRGTRNPERAARVHGEGDWVQVDVDDAASLALACEGCDTVVYLVHHMHDPKGDLVARERRAARGVARACAEASVARIVYLGAPVPSGSTSAHLVARRETGVALATAGVPVFELRASMIVGDGSESWRMVRDLAMRLPVMVLPAWLRSRTQPIWIGDVVAALARACTLEPAMAGIWSLPGPEAMSAREILLRTAAAGGFSPFTISVPVLTPALSSAWIRWVTDADMHVARKLVDGLVDDLVMPDDGLFAVCPELPRTPFDEAAARSLAPNPEARGLWAQVEALRRRS